MRVHCAERRRRHYYNKDVLRPVIGVTGLSMFDRMCASPTNRALKQHRVYYSRFNRQGRHAPLLAKTGFVGYFSSIQRGGWRAEGAEAMSGACTTERSVGRSQPIIENTIILVHILRRVFLEFRQRVTRRCECGFLTVDFGAAAPSKLMLGYSRRYRFDVLNVRIHRYRR